MTAFEMFQLLLFFFVFVALFIRDRRDVKIRRLIDNFIEQKAEQLQKEEKECSR